MRKLFLSVILFFFSVVLFLLHGQDITFHHLTTDDGLSQTSVSSMYQDELGRIWIGTREGLNRYNGNRIITYRLQKNNPNSLFCNNILRITGNQKGLVYVLCTEGLCEYNIQTDQFTTLEKSVDIQAFYYSDKLYIGKNNTIYALDSSSKKFSKVLEIKEPNLTITSLLVDRKGNFYIGTKQNGVYKASPRKQVTHVINNNSNITSIYEDSAGDIWIGSWEHGLFILSAGKITNMTHRPNDENSIQSNFVRTFCQDNRGYIWIGTFHGLDRLDKSTGELNHYLANGKPDGLTHSSIWAIIKDKQETIWLGTYFGGVNYFNPEYEIYTWYKPSKDQRNGLSSAIVGRMLEDKNHNLWICTEGGGVNVYSRETKTFKWYMHNATKNSISEDNVKAIYYDRPNDIMWFGTHLGGLNRLDIQTGVFTAYRYNSRDKTSIPSDIVRDIVGYQGSLILATSNGVAAFNPKTGKSTPFFNDKVNNLIKNVFALFIDHTNTLWISVMGEGVFTYNLQTRQLKQYKHDPAKPNGISNNNINCITQDSRHNIYLCTSGRGVDMYRPASDDFVNFDSKDNGLSSDCVYNMTESQPGRMLAITNKGFSIFDVDSKKFYNYSQSNGFPLSTVNENALYLTTDKVIFLGGVQGMVSFREELLNFTQKPYNIFLSQLYINGKEVRIGDEFNVLHQSMPTTKEISLKSSHSIFSIEFATTNYIKVNKEDIVYKLEGFTDEWTPVYGQNLITFTNLNPGTYTLIIKSNNSIQATKEVRLKIIITPPFYRTTIAYLIYLIIISVILYYLIHSYTERLKLKASLEYEYKRLEDIEKLNQSKLRFFTNISHELRTPITLIIGQIEILLQSQEFIPKTYNKIVRIYNNSLQLKELITELLNFRKQESGLMKLHVVEHDLTRFLQESYLLFEGYTKAKDIEFVFEGPGTPVMLWFDSKQMQKVVNNLLSNALKHTDNNGFIVLRLEQIEDEVVFRVKDNGCGINTQDMEHIFDPFYQVEHQNPDIVSSGTGIGLAFSKNIVELHHGRIEVESHLGEGATFSVFLQQGYTHFTREELKNEEIVEEDDDSITRPAESIQSQEAQAPSFKKPGQAPFLKMLIVEDNEELREMLVDIFTPFYIVTSAGDGEEALEKVKDSPPDIIVSDIMMPRMSGVELCQVIKSDLNTCHIPFVMLTAKTSVESNLEGLKTGADDYIAKPFNVNILVFRCHNLVNNRMMLREKFSKQPQMTPQMLATNALDKELIDKAVEIVENHLENPEFSVNDFAQEIGMSRSNLFTKLKAVSGQTPNDFILRIRLKKAAVLLKENPTLSVLDISIMVGFSSSRYFSKCFKDIYQLTPLSFRNDTLARENPQEDKES